MRRVIGEHLKDFIAIIALVAAGLFTAGYILSQQATALPSWVPLLGEERFELNAEFVTAQAVTPGQGQAVVIAGIQVGDITGVKLEDGNAVVKMEIDNEDAPLIKDDAHLLLRPKTGLNDMVIEVDPGVSDEQIEEGETVPLASSLPNVNPDEVLAALDADTQAFLSLLLAGGGEALDPERGRGRKLGRALRQFEPLARDVSRISGKLSKRRKSVARSIHNFRLLAEELGDKDQDLISFVDSSNAVLQSFANQEASISEALRELPPALTQTRGALDSANQFALASAPALRDSLPGARALAPALKELRPFFRNTTGPIRDQIRPFTKQVRNPVLHTKQIGVNLGKSVPGLKTGFSKLNTGLNALAYNPSGISEGYLFFVPWLNHNLNNTYVAQDAHGPIRRGVLGLTCATAVLAEGTLIARPYLRMLYQLAGQPRVNDIPGCA